MRSCYSLAWLALVLVSPVISQAADGEFTPLFDGTSLAGWTKVGGGATYKVEDGCIVGTVGPGPNTFLRTEKTYSDFILKVEAKLDVPGNSGIQFRSHQRDNGRVFGYQCEIDPSERAWTAGIYDEARRGWLYPLKDQPESRKAFKLDDWNQFEIQARGPVIKTFLNGVPCADLIDTMDQEGFIALQVHSGKQGQIRWRNVQIQELEPLDWKPLYNGKDLSGWETIGGGEWTISDAGVIRGTSSKDEARHGHLITKDTFNDFAVRVKYKARQGNSGLYFRAEKGGFAGVKGFQAEIDPAKDAGGLYETSGRGWVVKPSAEDVKKYYKPNEWNEMTVVALGDRIVVHVNGIKTAELTADPGRSGGHIALQLHGGQDMDVEFEEVSLMDLSSLTK